MTETPVRPTPYPVRVDAALDARLSRGLWLVKWLLLVPHYIVLSFLWLAFVVLTVVAFFAILFTARYPRALFDFNLGVLRWSWRVHYYGYGALGTDRYPPFTLADVPDYPARLDVPYPERLSRGLVLVKWWLLAIPHYLVLAVFIGGGLWLGTRGTSSQGTWDDGWAYGGLVGLLVFIAAVVLLFAGRYPRSIYDFVLGMDRWALRVAAYVSLMTDAYPPFRLDLGGTDPESLPVGPTPSTPGGAAAVPAAGLAPSAGASAAGGPVAYSQSRGSWTTGRVVSVVIGALLMLTSTGLLVGGGTLLWADRSQREDGFIWSPNTDVRSDLYAITVSDLRFDTAGDEWAIDRFLGRARIEATPLDQGVDLFVGVARSADAVGYLDGVGHHRLTDVGVPWGGGRIGPGEMTAVSGGAPRTAPTDTDIWVAESTGPGTRVLNWRPADGDWTVVVMRADGGAGVAADARAGATAPALGWIAGGVLGFGIVLLVIGALCIALAVPRTQAGPPSGGYPVQPGPQPGPQPTPDQPVLVPSDRR